MEAIFSATPPLESLRALCTLAASEEPGNADPLRLMVVDISRAHFYADASRSVFIKLPEEEPRSGEAGVCGRLLKTMYGTLDAADHWSAHYTQVLEKAGFTRGTASPCNFVHSQLGIWVLVHGDDFLVTGRSEGLSYMRQVIRMPTKLK